MEATAVGPAGLVVVVVVGPVVVVLVLAGLAAVVVVVGRGRVLVVDDVLDAAAAVVVEVVSTISRLGTVASVERERGPSAKTFTAPWGRPARATIAPTRTATPTIPASSRPRTRTRELGLGSSPVTGAACSSSATSMGSAPAARILPAAACADGTEAPHRTMNGAARDPNRRRRSQRADVGRPVVRK